MYENIQPCKRLSLIDLIRGFTIISMILYHFLWDIVYLFHFNIPWFQSHSRYVYIWQQSICWSFILIAGFCWQLGKHNLKRGLLVFFGGIIISFVTYIHQPDIYVRYGILTLIGSCIIILIVADRVLKWISPAIGIITFFTLFLILKNWTETLPFQLAGYHGNSGLINEGMAYIGFPQSGFSSLDYFPLLPWFFLFTTGYFLYTFITRKKDIQHLLVNGKLPIINYLGRHSFIIYLIHQPLCYILALLISHLF